MKTWLFDPNIFWCSFQVILYISSSYVAGNALIIPGQTTKEDPNACLWFVGPMSTRIYKCCDGYYKNDLADMTKYCKECAEGFYGKQCRSRCECANGSTCSKIDGSCQCPKNYFGSRCHYSCNCLNGGTCTDNGSCICTNGFHGSLCESRCSCPPNKICQDNTEECVCPRNYYGNSCEPCKCSDDGSMECDSVNGQCSCKPGYYGEHCYKKCHCYNGATCVNGDIDCRCERGWEGPKCTTCDMDIQIQNGRLYCYDKCLHCSNGKTCTVEKGDCLCTPGWEGGKCDQKCRKNFYGINCSEECKCEHGICDHVTGECQCNDGWTGQKCDAPCPDNCVMCKSDICSSCKPGWIGAKCRIPCSPGYHGNNCKEKCPQCNCNNSCNHINGSCLNTLSCNTGEYDGRNIGSNSTMSTYFSTTELTVTSTYNTTTIIDGQPKSPLIEYESPTSGCSYGTFPITFVTGSCTCTAIMILNQGIGSMQNQSLRSSSVAYIVKKDKRLSQRLEKQQINHSKVLIV